jgi:hypothetical protein
MKNVFDTYEKKEEGHKFVKYCREKIPKDQWKKEWY